AAITLLLDDTVAGVPGAWVDTEQNGHRVQPILIIKRQVAVYLPHITFPLFLCPVSRSFPAWPFPWIGPRYRLFLLRPLSVGIDVLYVVQIFQVVDHLAHGLGGVGVHLRTGGWMHGDLGIHRLQA